MVLMKGTFYNPETGKWISGTAAQLHYIRLQGGWEKYHEKLGSRITKAVVEEMENEFRKPDIHIVK